MLMKLVDYMGVELLRLDLGRLGYKMAELLICLQKVASREVVRMVAVMKDMCSLFVDLEKVTTGTFLHQ